MAIGRFTVFDRALTKLGDATINLDDDAFKVALLGPDQPIAADFAGEVYGDLTDEVAGGGYTAGGAALAGVTWTRADAVVTFSADPTTWTGLDVTAKYAVVYRDEATKDLLGFFDIDDALPAGRVFSSVDTVLSWPAGAFTLTRV